MASVLLERIARQMTGEGLTLVDDAELRHPTLAVGAFHTDVCVALVHSVDEFLGVGFRCVLTSHSSLQ